MVRTYDTVCTNPPYMGAGGMSVLLTDYVKKEYASSKSDLSTVFMEKCLKYCINAGYVSMINIPVWMFIKSYTNLREKLLNETSFINMLHCGRGKRMWFFEGKGRYLSKQDLFASIPNQPFAYWASDQVVNDFQCTKLSEIAAVKKGMSTANDDRFIRLWYEVSQEKVGQKWFCVTKGGEFRKWYGNRLHYVNWENNGAELRAFSKSVLRNTQYYFNESICWNYITISKISFKYYSDFAFTAAAPCVQQTSDLMYILGFGNSCVANELIMIIGGATVTFEVGEVGNLPIIYSDKYKDRIDGLVESNIELSKRDWDSTEVSWDYEEHPFIRWSKGLWDATSIAASMDYFYGGHSEVSCPLELCFMLWKGECNERFKQIKSNEEELNRIFIDIYGLQDELTPEVEDKDVTVRKADLQRDMRSFVSYAVGCMLGRYSLDTEGLAYAGGDWDSEKYKSFIPDEDNCIPITDTAYFEDDIVGRFCEFVKVVFGEDTLEANLEYVAKALGNKGNSSRDIIRNYFLNDFFKDHCKIYQKRPIYWLFDSGKQNGFKALVYMHRWNADTIGNMRVEYLHRIQRTYEKEIEREQDTIDNTTNNRDRATATKRKEKLLKQLKEAKDYDAKVAHLALSRPDIDLDDGVKVNYEKVQTAQDGKKLQILAKI